jgi:hypothetical protein
VLPPSGGLKIGRQIRDNLQTEIRFEYSLNSGAPIPRSTGLPIFPALAFGFGLMGIARLFYSRGPQSRARPRF